MIERSREPARGLTESTADTRLAAALLVAGGSIFLAGVAFYLTLGAELGLPAFEARYPVALSAARRLGDRMELAGVLTLLGDLLVVSAALVLARRPGGGALERLGWVLTGVSFVPAVVFDAMMGSALVTAAQQDPPAQFFALKRWFDLLFIAGNVPFGLGLVLLFWPSAAPAERLLPRPIGYLVGLFGALAVIGAVLYLLRVTDNRTLNGTPLVVGGLALTAVGIRGLRSGRTPRTLAEET